MTDFLTSELQKIANPHANQPTRGTRARESAEAVKQIAIKSVLQFVQSLNEGFDLIWSNEYGLSPQEVCDALGTEASGVFQRHASAAQYLVSQSPAVAPLLRQLNPQYVILHEPDGRVKITEKE
jgi:hypothetical protein